MLQRDNDQDACVLTDNAVIEASKFCRLRAILCFLDGFRRLPERHADADVVHRQGELQDVVYGHRVDRRVVLLAKQLHRIFLLVLLLNELLAGCVSRILLAVIVINVFELLVIAKEEVANDALDDLGTDEELVCILVHIKMVMQRVGCLDAPTEMLFLLVD